MQDTGDEIALGFSRNLQNFKQVAPQALNYADMGLEPFAPDFASQILSKIRAARWIHFDLSNMTHLNTPDGILHGPTYLNPLGSTNWELRTIWDDPVLRAKTNFYRDGVALSLTQVLDLY